MDVKRTSALERARADLADGRPDRARDRLHGYLSSLHQRGEYSEEAYALLGETLFEMKDFPRAGAAWLLTEREDAPSQFSIDAFYERYGSENYTNILNAISPRAPSEIYPAKVRERLSGWGYRYLPYKSRNQPGEPGGDEARTTGLRPFEAGCVLFLILCALFAAFYLYQVFFGKR